MASSRFFTTLLLAAGAAAQLQLALSPPRHNNAAALSRRQRGESDMQRPVDLDAWFYPYAVNVSIGTPGQEQSLALTFSYTESLILRRSLCRDSDDSSSDDDVPTWSLLDCNNGAYDPRKSRSYNETRSEYSYSDDPEMFDEVYGSRAVSGTLMKETINIAGDEVTDLGFRLASDTALESGFLALGWATPSDEFSILNEMTYQGAILSQAFSLWAQDDRNGTTGHILFGAVDRSKYHGPIKRLQASKYKYDKVPGYAVNVSSAMHTTTESSETRPFDEWFDFFASISPTTMITNLPMDVAQPLLEQANATLSTTSDLWVVDCNTTDSIKGGFALELGGEGGYLLHAWLRDLVVPSESWFESKVWNMDEPEPVTWCLFGIQSTGKTHNFNHDSIKPWVIGNMVLKSTYMVFDANNMEVGLAPLRMSLRGDADRWPFSLYGETIPDSLFAGYKQCFEPGGCSDDGTVDQSYPYENDENAVVTKVIIGIACGLGGLALIIGGLTFWAVRRCRRIRKARAAEEATTAKEGGDVVYTPEEPMAPPGAAMMAVGGPVPRKPLPTQTTVEAENIKPQETRMLSPEPKSTRDLTLAGTVSPESTPREPPARLATPSQQ